MSFVGGNAWRDGRLPLAAVVLVLLAGQAGATIPLAPLQQTILDSLQILHVREGADAVARLVNEELPVARADGDSVYVMRLLGARGSSYTFYHQAARAMADLDEAVELAVDLGDTSATGRLLLWRARAREVQGLHGPATDDFRRVARLGRVIGNPFFEARGMTGVAWDAWLEGDYARAESLYARASTVAVTAGDSFTVLWARNGQGLCYWNLGELARADTAFATVRREGRRRGIGLIEAAGVNNHSGLLEVLGRPGEALVGYRQSYEQQLAAGNLREAFPSAMNVARCQHQLGRYDDAVATVNGLIAMCREAGFRDLVASALERLARIRLAQQRPALAARHCREGLAMDDVLQPRTEVELQVSLAGALAEQDSLAEGLTMAERAARMPAIRDDTHMQAETAVARGSILVQLGDHAAAADVFAAAAVDVEAAGLVVEQLTLKSRTGEALLLAGRPDAARPWLDGALLLWESTRSLPDDPIWRERRSGDARRLFEALAELTLFYPDSVPVVQRQRRCFDLLQHYKARTLLERTMGPGRELADPAPVTLDAMQHEVLRPGEVFVDCYVGERQGLVLATTADTLVVVSLRDRRAVRAAVDVLQGQLETVDRPFAAAQLLQLGEGLIDHPPQAPRDDGLAALLERAEVIHWSPDDVLHQVPLAAFLADRRVVSARVPSATFLANLRREEPPLASGPIRILAVAGVGDGDGRRLSGSIREVDWLADRYRGVDAVVDTLAGEPFGGRDPADYDLLHLAAHAEVDGQRPWSSALVLGPTDQPRRLRAGAVAELDLDARLAVLSTCNSASSAVLSGEGMLGLASGFLSAGVPAVVATLWPVDDRHAEQFSHRFYDELADGHPPATALQRTRDRLRGHTDTAHPYHWAGYVLVGEGTRPVPLAARKETATWIGAGGGLVAVICSLVVVRRQRQRKRVNGRV